MSETECICVCVCVSACAPTCVCVCPCPSVYVCTSACTCPCVCKSACSRVIYINVHTCILGLLPSMHTCLLMPTHTSVQSYRHICGCLCGSVHVYVCVWLCLYVSRYVSICLSVCVNMDPGPSVCSVWGRVRTCGCARMMHIQCPWMEVCTQPLGTGMSPRGVQDEVGGSSPRSHAVHPRCRSHRSVSSWLRRQYPMFIERKSMPDEYHKWKLLPGPTLSLFQRTWHSGVMTSSCLPAEGQRKSDYKIILLLFSSVNGSSLFHYRLYCEVRLHRHLFAFIICTCFCR